MNIIMNTNQEKINTKVYFCFFKKYRHMKFLVIIISFFISFSSCQNTDSETSEKAAAKNYAIYGDSSITLDGAIETKELMTMLESTDSADVKLTAEVVGVCKMKGCWMDVKVDDSTNMLVRFKDYGFFVPMDCEGKQATILGQVKKVTHSVEWLRHKAEDAGKSAEEIASITEPEVAYSIDEATSVILQ